MREYAITIGIVAVALVAALWVVNMNPRIVPSPIGGRACTMEAKICPDGSAVGRTGPNCEFAPCPTAIVATSTANGGGSSSVPHDSGVRGTVLLGPTCPVERMPPDPACADKPYATTVVVHHTGSSFVFATGESDASGAFEFWLPPGSYTLTAGSGKTLPRCAGVDVTVAASGYATTTISCDTGIR